MQLVRSWRSAGWTSIVAAGLLALLGGCVVYPAGYGAPHQHYDWHGRDRGWR